MQHAGPVAHEPVDAEPLAGQPPGAGVGIVPADPDQDDKAGSNLGDYLAVDPNGPPADPLDDGPQLGCGLI